ncbi:pentapeptide repeat-containing protein [Streptomyces niveus]|uniref:pentapeptide repeat-containing protein n=1 Tax=Streptomyces niveus TaxID=193462 RepID=UPI003868A6F9
MRTTKRAAVPYPGWRPSPVRPAEHGTDNDSGGSPLAGADLTGADLTGVCLSYADLRAGGRPASRLSG